MTDRERTVLRHVTRALRTHLEDEAKREGVKAGELCPCMTNELREAEALLEESTP